MTHLPKGGDRLVHQFPAVFVHHVVESRPLRAHGLPSRSRPWAVLLTREEVGLSGGRPHREPFQGTTQLALSGKASSLPARRSTM